MVNIQNSANYEKLKNVLKEVFQLDQADLDFGIYRIMNQKRNEINDFLDNRLLPQVKEILLSNGDGSNIKAQQELDTAIEQANALGVDPASLPKVQELKGKLTSTTSVDSLEQEVYSHLANFFRRYYKDGDFISLRRYKKDVYAIPYEGEEVKLHWANHDQYYIKTSEYLKNYGFKLPNGKSVKFELKEASTEQNNNKEKSGKERRFQLFEELPLEVSEDGKTLIVNFTYEEHDTKINQADLLEEAYETIVASNNIDEFKSLLIDIIQNKTRKKKINGKNKDVPLDLLYRHLRDFTARNSFDYFIHKDLGGFLSRELDFYIKNEVLYLDDINTDNEQDFTTQLSKVKAIKQVAQKIITFLAQLENFQKKLWLKKKFVVSTNYCITLDRIPEKYYEEIAKNKDQLEEWKELFKIDQIKGDLLTIKYSEPLTEDFLKSQPYLVLDTKFFNNAFKESLLGEFDNLEEQTNGLMINSENFQALNTVKNKYSNKVGGVYIDPPYNTKSSEIIYKNDYKHSSWLALMNSRLKLSKSIINDTGIHCLTIDDLELPIIWTQLNEIFEQVNHLGTAVIRINPGGRKSNRKLALQHEYGIFMGKSENSKVAFFEKAIEDKTHTYKIDDKGEYYEERNLRKEGADSLAKPGAERFYPIYYSPKTGQISTITKLEMEILPIDTSGQKRIWRRGAEVIDAMYDEGNLEFKETKYGSQIYFKFRGGTEGEPPRSFWDDKSFSASEHGTQVLDNILGEREKFSFPKSIHAVIDCLKVISNSKNEIYMDYFSGSGTTGHAVIKMNRTDKGRRKFILIEMGEYFDSVTKPRIQKVIYSDNWENGNPQDNQGISLMFKYQDLESYEDVLNNLSLVQNKTQSNLLESSDFKDEYMLSYMLDVESRESLLNIDAFKNPFNYKLNITRNNESQETVIDLVETFNYLIGLHVKTIQTIRGFKVITGVTNERNEETLVIWRNTEEKSNQDLNEFFIKMEFSSRDSEFHRIYVNGDNHIENLKTGDDNWKVVLIEEEFMKRMFDVQDI